MNYFSVFLVIVVISIIDCELIQGNVVDLEEFRNLPYHSTLTGVAVKYLGENVTLYTCAYR